ncbi:hypothetical protein GYMLUDRAFT_244832 [Collybiopsis luxurians FD-317 M1]|uniref:Uncharacterized protein n=1 Tax=Collybiopsis luxurians FD-317 M1 TaxID=944289 RepID=A0A0D0CC35_9AGAR|nr:hypothetical protein GYMLUDRAFT_244832 [Collybiopsis luxurians FD-317 M1]
MAQPSFDPKKNNIRWDEGDPTRRPDPERAGTYKLFDTGDNKKPFNDAKKAIETAEKNTLHYAGARAAEGLEYTYEINPYKVRYGFAIVATYYEKPWVWFDGQGDWKATFDKIVAPAIHNALLGYIQISSLSLS